MTMMTRLNNHLSRTQAEAGQAIVFVALFMVLLVGMLGLAIDGGGLFFEWRAAQNATDSAALAAAYSRCAGDEIAQAKQRGLTVAGANGYTDTDPNTNATVDPDNPDVRVFFGDSGQTGNITLRDGSTQAENAFVADQIPPTLPADDFVFLDIYVEKPSYFIQVIYPYPLVVNPRAVAACNPGFAGGDVPGAFAYGDCGGGSTRNTLNFTGADSYYQGDLHSNGGAKFPGNSGMVMNGTVITYVNGTIDASKIKHHKSLNAIEVDGPGKTWKTEKVTEPLNPGMREYFNPERMEDLYGPGGVFEDYITTTYGADYYTYDPDGINIKKNDSADLKGLYYVEGDVSIVIDDDVTIHNMNTLAADRGVSIIATGDIDINSQQAPNGYYWEFFQGIMDEIPSEDDQRYPGFLAASMNYATDTAACNNSYDAVQLDGKTSDTPNPDYENDPVTKPTTFEGVYYAYNGIVTLGGAAQSYTGVMVGFQINFSGSKGIFFYDDTLLPTIPPESYFAG